MKTEKLTAAIILSAAVLVTAACSSSSPGYVKADEQGAKIEAHKATLKRMVEKLDATMMSLDQLVDPASTDPRGNYEKFARNDKDLRGIVEDARERFRDSEENAKKLFAAWEKESAEITDPDLKRASVDRRTRLYGISESLRVSLQASNSAVTEFLKESDNARRFGSTNLTTESLVTLQPTVEKARVAAAETRLRVDQALRDLEAAGVEFEPTSVVK